MSEGGFVICRPAPRPYKHRQSFGFRLMSDLHIGAADCDYKLIAAELAEAKKNGDRILINGDVFDLILPKDMKRYTPGALHKRISQRQDVLNAAVEWGVEILAPYADLIDMIGIGNHETAVEKYHGSDAVRFLIDGLTAHAPKDHVIHYGGYMGFVDYRWRRDYAGGGGDGRRYVIYYYHGSGGSAPVTKGMMDFNRKGWVRADCKWIGHKHNRFAMHECGMECPFDGDAPTLIDVRCVMTGSYFSTYHGQTQESIREHGRKSSYAADFGMSPQGKGGARIVVTMLEHKAGKQSVQVIQ